MKVLQDRIRVNARDTVGLKTHVKLEFPQGSFGIGSERTAHPAAREAQSTKSRLQFFDIFAREIRRAQIQEAVTQVKPITLFILTMNGWRNHSAVHAFYLRRRTK